MSIYSDVSQKYKIIINLEREIINKKINVSKLKDRFLVFKYYLNTRKLAQYLNKRYETLVYDYYLFINHRNNYEKYSSLISRSEIIELLFKDDEKKYNFKNYDSLYDELIIAILDMYYSYKTLHCIIKNLKFNICLTNKDKLYNIIKNDKKINENNHHKQYIVDEICKTTSINKAWNLFKDYEHILHNYSIIKGNITNFFDFKSIDIFEKFNYDNSKEFKIYSIFNSNKVTCINKNSLHREKNSSTSERNVIFDTCVVSYLLKYFNDNFNNKSIDISNIIYLIKSNIQITVSYLPYLIENRLSKNFNWNNLKKDIEAIENFYYKTFPINYDLYNKRVNETIKLINNPIFLEELQQLYDSIYAKILIVSWVHLSSNKSSSKKFSKLCSIFSTELFDYSIPELSMAYDFYFNNSVDILSFIQKSTKDLLSKIKNVSWDIFHIRYAYKTSISVEGADVCIQYFCTYDKNLVSMLKYYKLNALCINISQNEVKPYFKNDIIPIEYYKIYFSNMQSKQINYKYIISKYEKLLEDL